MNFSLAVITTTGINIVNSCMQAFEVSFWADRLAMPFSP